MRVRHGDYGYPQAQIVAQFLQRHNLLPLFYHLEHLLVGNCAECRTVLLQIEGRPKKLFIAIVDMLSGPFKQVTVDLIVSKLFEYLRLQLTHPLILKQQVLPHWLARGCLREVI